MLFDSDREHVKWQFSFLFEKTFVIITKNWLIWDWLFLLLLFHLIRIVNLNFKSLCFKMILLCLENIVECYGVLVISMALLSESPCFVPGYQWSICLLIWCIKQTRAVIKTALCLFVWITRIVDEHSFNLQQMCLLF